MSNNAAILAEITITYRACKVLVDSINDKKTVQTAHYIVEVTRSPVPDGVHLSATPDAPGGGGKAGGGGGMVLHFAMSGQQQPPPSSIIELHVPSLEVVRRPVVRRTPDILAVFPVNLQITPVNDLFNDKLDFTCAKYADLERLVVTMEPVYLKYALFGEQPTVTATLQAFALNYERVQSGLKAVWAHIQDQESKAAQIPAQIQGQLVKANEAMRAAAGLGARFFRKDPSTAPPEGVDENKLMSCNSCGRDAVIVQADQAVNCPCGYKISPQFFAQQRQLRQQRQLQQQFRKPTRNVD